MADRGAFKTVAASSWGIASLSGVRQMLGTKSLRYRPLGLGAKDPVLGWGRKPHAEAARRRAERAGVPYLSLEDGFVRSIGLGVDGAAPWSLVVDDVGVYYDATQPSRLELLLNHSLDLDDPALLARARLCMERMRRARISKYNASPTLDLGPKHGHRVLVVDQTAGDLSLRLGLAPARGVAELVEAALRDHPHAEVIVKTHPDVASGQREGSALSPLCDPRVRLITAAANPMALLAQVDEAYVMTSLLGFEALMAGLPVTCFGMPFYAGWGATRDRQRLERRMGTRSVEQIFAAAYLLYARYVHPVTGAACQLEQVLEHIERQGAAHHEASSTTIAVGFSPWKRGFLPGFLAAPAASLRFVADAAEAERGGVPPGARIIVWGARVPTDVADLARRYGARVVRMEDGFLRSVGLGSDLYAPASLVLDATGIYYDPSRPSDLESLLVTKAFTDSERARARALRETIVRTGISKYNVGSQQQLRAAAAHASGQRVVLVVGQVEDDASIQLGCVDVRTNLDLLKEARSACPGAFIVWKPHPDVVSGNRQGAVAPEVARALADEVAPQATLAACLAVVHEVHTMTSLVGFEALLRGLDVVVYGQPFYAGWGLTRDRHAHPRRGRRLTLDELVHGTLVDYPTYVDPNTSAVVGPEEIVAMLESSRVVARHERLTSLRKSWAGRQLRKASNLLQYATLAVPQVDAVVRRARSVASVVAPAVSLPVNPAPPFVLGLRHALLLQGPAGPFFRHFGDELSAAGLRVTKVNLHAGDALFYPGPDVEPYRGTLADWREWVADLMRSRGVDGVFVFGDCRAYHQQAIEAARELGVSVWVFEEGYLRPDWITLERDGVNGNSRLPRDASFYRDAYRAAGSPPEAKVAPVGDTFAMGAWYSTANAIAFTFANRGYPHYQHHRNLGAWYHAHHWVLGAGRKLYFERVEAGLQDEIVERWSGRYFFVPLQVHCDFQIKHSPYGDVVEFIHEVVASFAEHAPEDCALVLKHHPMDRPFRDYSALFRELARKHHLEGRLYYVHDLHLPTLLQHARGTVTINSTVGLNSIHHGTPALTTGTAIYDIPGLTHQGSLEDMWRDPGTVDRELYRAFRWWLLETIQGNGHMFRRVHACGAGTGVRWPNGPNQLG